VGSAVDLDAGAVGGSNGAIVGAVGIVVSLPVPSSASVCMLEVAE
jgi:hypothetical protein